MLYNGALRNDAERVHWGTLARGSEELTLSETDIVIRHLETAAELDTFFRVAMAVFEPGEASEEAVRGWQYFVTHDAEFQIEFVRGAFRDGKYVGGYIMMERSLRMEDACLRAGCLSAVGVLPDHQGRGVGAALMKDAVARAEERGLALLLLDGIGGFYHRFGYVDVLDIAEYHVACADILVQRASPYRVRRAGPADVGVLLDLYRRHFAGYLGAFDRSLALQQHRLRSRPPEDAPLLAVDPAGEPRGYLTLGYPRPPDRSRATEVAADDWPAALALLQYHAQLLKATPGQPERVRWPLPPASPTFYALADHLTVESRCQQMPDADWMARVANLDALVLALLPVWQGRWRRARPEWQGSLAFDLDGETGHKYGLDLGPEGVRLWDGSSVEANSVATLSRQAFIQLVFGYRPIRWLACQPGASVPDALWPALGVLFPVRQAWVSGSDKF
ncbi:MAG: GNAT family N-acetyltransferase [Chloroflexota bacterium]